MRFKQHPLSIHALAFLVALLTLVPAYAMRAEDRENPRHPSLQAVQDTVTGGAPLAPLMVSLDPADDPGAKASETQDTSSPRAIRPQPPQFYTKTKHPKTGQEIVGRIPYTLRPIQVGDKLRTDPFLDRAFFYAGRVPLAFLAQMDLYTQQRLGDAPHKSWMLTNPEGQIVGYFNYLDQDVLIHIHDNLEKQGLGRQIHRWLLDYYGAYLGKPDLQFTPKEPWTWENFWSNGATVSTIEPEAVSATTLEEYLDITEAPYLGFIARLPYKNPPALSIFQENLGLARCKNGCVEAEFPLMTEWGAIRDRVMALIVASQKILKVPCQWDQMRHEYQEVRNRIRQELALFETDLFYAIDIPHPAARNGTNQRANAGENVESERRNVARNTTHSMDDDSGESASGDF